MTPDANKNHSVNTINEEFQIEHFDQSTVVPPRLGRFSLADVKLRPQQVLSWLGVPMLLMPSAAIAYEGVDPWLLGRVSPI